MKTVINILFVYIPFCFCVFIQLILLLSLYTAEEDVAFLAKWLFPLIFIASVVLHFLKRNKNGA